MKGLWIQGSRDSRLLRLYIGLLVFPWFLAIYLKVSGSPRSCWLTAYNATVAGMSSGETRCAPEILQDLQTL